MIVLYAQLYLCVCIHIWEGRGSKGKLMLFPKFSVYVNSERKSRSLFPLILGQGSSLSSMTTGKYLYTNRGTHVGLLKLKIAKVVQCCNLEKG